MDHGDDVNEQLRREQERREQESIEVENSEHRKGDQMRDVDEAAVPLCGTKSGAGLLLKNRASSTDSTKAHEDDDEFAENIDSPLEPTEKPEQVIQAIKNSLLLKILQL